jgi:alpha-amylase
MSSRRQCAAITALSLVVSACATATSPSSTAGRSSPASSGSVAPSHFAAASPLACAETPAVAPAVPWWHDRVFYEVFVRSFADSDGDGIGDLQGLIGRLDYLNDGDPSTVTDLGITGIWLMPVAEATSYHGYDVTDYRTIEHDYGTNDDFRSLVREAHQRGIAVIVDLVLNHTSIEHPWFQDSRTPGAPHAAWYRWSTTNPGYAGPFGGQVWHPDGGRFYYAQFSEAMPDLDLTNAAVTDELVDTARQWIVDLGVDGFRLDAVKHLVEEGQQQTNTPATHAWLRQFRDRVRTFGHDALLLGEVFDPTIVSSSYVPQDVDMTFEFELAGQMLLGARIGEGPSLANTQRDVLERYSGPRYAAFLTNHDQARVMTQLNDLARARVAASVLLTNPGVPFVYYGEELGMAGDKPDERIRSPMPWDGSAPGAGFTSGKAWEDLEPGWEVANVATETADAGSLLAHYRSLIRVRATHSALSRGSYVPLASTAPSLLAYLAIGDDESVAVIVNLGSKTVTNYSLATDLPTACEPSSGAILYNDGVGATVPISLPSVTPLGGFDAWTPLPALPPYATLVVGLSP